MRNRGPVLYWRLIDEKTEKWTFKKATVSNAFQMHDCITVEKYKEEQ
jgi:hypothetical protein